MGVSNKSWWIGVKSEIAPVISGIPQGTVLGPVLFVIYINDLLDNIKSDGLMFADNTKIFRHITSREDALALQSDIKLQEHWSDKWQLQFHPDKCHVLTLGKLENIRHAHRLCDLQEWNGACLWRKRPRGYNWLWIEIRRTYIEESTSSQLNCGTYTEKLFLFKLWNIQKTLHSICTSSFGICTISMGSTSC